MHGGGASLQFGAGMFVDPNLVADGHWTVSSSAAPIALSAGLQRYGTIHVADAGDARWRIFFFIRSRLRSRKTQKTGETQQQAKAALTGKCDRLHDESPVLGLEAGRWGPLMRRSRRRGRNILFFPLGRTPQWERSCHRWRAGQAA